MRRRSFLSALLVAPVACGEDMRVAVSISVDNPGQTVVTPIDVPELGASIASVPVRFEFMGSKGTIAYDPEKSNRISAWADQSGNAYESMNDDAIHQPIAFAETPTQVGLRFDGVSDGDGDYMVATDLDLPLAGTLNTYILMVARINEFVSGRRFFGTEIGTACREVYMIRTLGLDYIEMINGVVSANAVTCPAEGEIFLLEVLFSNSTSDRLRAGNAAIGTGTNTGNRDRDGFVIGRGSDTGSNGSFDLFELLCTDGEISAGEKTALRALFLERYPAISMGDFGA